MSTHTASENSSSSEVLTYSLHLTLLLFCASCCSLTSLVSVLVSSLVMAGSDDYEGIDELYEAMKNDQITDGGTSKECSTENTKSDTVSNNPSHRDYNNVSQFPKFLIF